MTFLRSCILVAGATMVVAQPDQSEQAALKVLADNLQATEDMLASHPTDHLKGQCWQDAHLHIKKGAASLLQTVNVPGAGIDKFKPFEKVLKDGFLPVGCVKDYMYYRGDKFGDNKHDYKLGATSDVSIVHYDAFVVKEDQAEMTQKKCFEFCRTVPNMGFFGITNGRSCYCTPYYQAMESDSSQCDVLCEGEQTKMCGGGSKSSVFAMHMCDSTAQDLKKSAGKSTERAKEIAGLVTLAKGLSADMQDMAAQLQKRFGAVGDQGATALLQAAKVFAGNLVHKAEEADEAATKLGELSTSASSLKGFASPATVTKAERLMEDIDTTLAKAEATHDELVTLEALAKGEHEARGPMTHDEAGDSLIQVQAVSADAHAVSVVEPETNKVGKIRYYMPGPWFRICGGVGCTLEKCLPTAVEKKECQGYFEVWKQDEKYAGGSANSYCFCRTAVDFDEAKMIKYGSRWEPQTWKYTLPPKRAAALDQYYPVMYFVDKAFEDVPTTCNGDLVAKPIAGQSADSCAASCDSHIHSCVAFQFFKDGDKTMCFMFSKFKTGVYYTGCGKAFLQTDAAPFQSKCYAKLSKFVGTTLKPNPSGKCEQCFTDLTKADRCYQ